jgi:hypothetical protein
VSDNVDITYTAANYGKAPGDKESLPADAAKKLVQAGVAKFSNKTSAKAAGVDPDAS